MRANQAMTETIHLSTQTRPIDKVRFIQARCGVFNLDTSAQSPMVSDSTQYYVYMCVCCSCSNMYQQVGHTLREKCWSSANRGYKTAWIHSCCRSRAQSMPRHTQRPGRLWIIYTQVWVQNDRNHSYCNMYVHVATCTCKHVHCLQPCDTNLKPCIFESSVREWKLWQKGERREQMLIYSWHWAEKKRERALTL